MSPALFETISEVIEIAGVPVRWNGSPSVIQWLNHFYMDYSSNRPPLLNLYTRLGNDPEAWEDEDPEFKIDGLFAKQRDFLAVREGSNIMAFMSPVISDSVHNLLRWALPPVLLQQSAFLVHGAAVISGNRGYVFFGPSGAGKSTVARLISESDPTCLVIGDDAIILRVDPLGRLFVCSAPLGCGYSQLAPPKLEMEVERIFLLKQDDRNHVESLSLSEATAALLGNVMGIEWSDDTQTYFAVSKRMVQSSTGIQRLHFARDGKFWEMIKK